MICVRTFPNQTEAAVDLVSLGLVSASPRRKYVVGFTQLGVNNDQSYSIDENCKKKWL